MSVSYEQYFYESNTVKITTHIKYFIMIHEKHVDSMLFNYETTYRTDYRGGEIREYPKTVYKARSTHSERKEPAYKNVHTMTAWKGVMPPFNILHKPKDVIRTNPNDIPQPYDKLVDRDREDVQKTRPRLVMTPSLSMDDIDDQSARDLLIADMYMSDTARAFRKKVSTKYNNNKAPLPGRPAPSNPIVLQKLQPPLVSPEWRMESVTWDQDQLRGHCDPTEHFWLAQELPKCKMCEDTEVVRVHRKMLRDMKRSNR